MTTTLLTDDLAVPPPEPERPPADGPADWLRRNLFRSPIDGVVTVVSAVIVLYVLYRLARFAFSTGRWEIVRVNLKLFMVGRYPDDQLWRPAVVLAVIAFVGGLVAGWVAHRRAVTGRTEPGAVARPWWQAALALVARLWPLLVGIGLLLLLSDSTGLWLTVGGIVAGAVVGRIGGRFLPATTVVIVVLCMVAFVACVAFLLDAAGWDEWGGMMLNLFLAVTSITLCFPLGVLLALGRAAGRDGSRFAATLAALTLGLLPIVLLVILSGGFEVSRMLVIVLVLAAAFAFAGWRMGRRSSLPLVRALSVGYIELFRGVPLYVLLLLSYLALGFFLPTWVENPPGLVVRAIVALTLFTAAYVAEIVRGGLQSLPKGQTEASQALGMSPVKTTGLIVLPQALRNVIPALVGQFISLFKDTTLAAAAIGFLDHLRVAQAVTSQGPFEGQRLTAETVSFVMLLFWVGCITMSRESQRLERRLGVGTR